MKISRLLIAIVNLAAAVGMFYFVAINHSTVGIVVSVLVFMIVDLSAGFWLMRKAISLSNRE